MSMLYRLKALSSSSGRSAAGRLASSQASGRIGVSLRTEGIAPSAAAATAVCCAVAGASIVATNSPLNAHDESNSIKVIRSNGSVSKCKCEGRPLLANRKATLLSGGGGVGPFRLHEVYDVEKTLGEGAYGTVFRARRKMDGQLVALKTMPRQYTGSSDFEREVAALQILSKPPGSEHVVKLVDLHRDDDNYYLAMEYIEGGELLESLIENGPYSEGMAASFIRQFAEAISYVHSNNLLHSDLKPENLLLSSSDLKKATLKLADFGCATSHDLSRKEMLLPAEEFAKGCSFLHMVALGNQFELEKMLMERPHLVNFRDYDFRTPLHLAASEGHVDICRFLVRKGARVNRSDRWGGSCLDDAYRHRHSDVIQYLREQGATFGAKTQLPRFIQAASEGDVAEVRALLEFGNVDLDEGDYDHRTALHLAAGEGRAEVVELLCMAGANPNVEDRWGGRPLDDAANAKSNSVDVMKLLVSFGAQSQKNPSLRDKVKDFYNAATSRKPTRRGAKKKVEGEDEPSSSGTIAYWPPEMHVDGAKPTPATDLWAAGVIMYICLTGSHPFEKYGILTDDEIKETVIRICCDKSNYEKLMDEHVFDERVAELSDSCVELMRSLLHPDPEQRCTGEAFLRHPWTQGLTASWNTIGGKALRYYWQNKFRADIEKKFGASADEDKGKLREIFNAIDQGHDGILHPNELRVCLRSVGEAEDTISKIIASLGLNRDGRISWEEFKVIMGVKEESEEAPNS